MAITDHQVTGHLHKHKTQFCENIKTQNISLILFTKIIKKCMLFIDNKLPSIKQEANPTLGMWVMGNGTAMVLL